MNRGIEGAPLSEVRPAPAYLQPDFKLIAAQPSPSEINPSFVGPVLFLKSAQVDLVKGTAKLPLYQGRLKTTGETVWFVLTDSTDENLSNLHGLNYSPKFAYSWVGRNQRTAEIQKDATWTFSAGKIDFAPKVAVAPGDAPNFFPPKSFQPGSVGDNDYTPVVRVTNAGKDVVFNAPMLAFNVPADELNRMCDGTNVDKTKVHDKVVAICPRERTVTLELTIGTTFGRPILYLSTEANNPLVATLEGATYAPAMEDIPFAHEDATPGESGERIYVFANGPTGLDNPQRQGLDSALSDGRGPINVLGGVPFFNLDYSPLWRLFPSKWTDEAIQRGYRSRMNDALQIEDMAAKGFIKSLDNGDLRAVGFVVNCPVVYRIN
ncbi:MAG: hypothetical protein JO048_17495 [Methylobacteriaceae bacterium]|nr:hypothetical protein [Methylobacteriaceae bacterium]